MANIKEIKVGNTIYNVKDKQAITGIKIGEYGEVLHPDTYGTIELPAIAGGSYTEDTAARAAIVLLNNRLANLAFTEEGKPTITFDVQYFNIQIQTSGLQHCFIENSVPESVMSGQNVVIKLKTDTNYEFGQNSIGQSNFEVVGDSQPIDWINSGFISDKQYQLVFTGVVKPINIKIKNINAIESATEQVTVGYTSNTPSTWRCNNQVDSVDLDAPATFIFEITNNKYAFKDKESIIVSMQEPNGLDIDRYIQKTLKNDNKTLEISISTVTGSISFTINTYYVHTIKASLKNCSCPSLLSRVIGDYQDTVQITPNQGFTFQSDKAGIAINPPSCGSYELNNNIITLDLNLTGTSDVTIDVVAAEIEEVQPITTKVTLKLLNMHVTDNDFIQDDVFGYYYQNVSNSGRTINIMVSDYEQENVTKMAEFNNDLQVLGIDQNGESVVIPSIDAPNMYTYTVEDGQNGNYIIRLRQEILENYKEIIISATAHKERVTFTCNENVQENSCVILTCKNSGNTVQNISIALRPNDTSYAQIPEDYIITDIRRTSATGPRNLLEFGDCITEIDFGGHIFSTEQDHKQLFSVVNKTSVLTNVTGLVVKSVPNLKSWFLDCKKLEHLDTIGWDLSNVTSMTSAFRLCGNNLNLDLDYKGIENLKELCVPLSSGALTCVGCFQSSGINTLLAGGWKINQEEDAGPITFDHLFYGSTVKELDLSTWEVKNLISLSRAFQSCNQLQKLDIRNIETNRTDSDSGYVLTDMSYAFAVNGGIDDVYVGNLNAGASNLNITGIVNNSGKIGTLHLESSNALEINHDKDWIGAAADKLAGNTAWYTKPKTILIRP